MKLNRISDEQLELGLPRPGIKVTIRRKRSPRAAWWFEQMRRAVDSTVDWNRGDAVQTDQLAVRRWNAA